MRNGSTARDGRRGDVCLSFDLKIPVLGSSGVHPPSFPNSVEVIWFVRVGKGVF